MRRLIGAGIAALVAAMFWRESSSQPTPGYTPYDGLTGSIEGAMSGARHKEMIEIQRETHLASLIKFHPPERPNKPITGLLGINCYIGSSRRLSSTLATTVNPTDELCIGSELDTNPEIGVNEQNQLKALLV